MKTPQELVEAYLDESLEPDEIRMLREWLAADASHVREFVLAMHQHHSMRVWLRSAATEQAGGATRTGWHSRLREIASLVRRRWRLSTAVGVILLGLGVNFLAGRNSEMPTMVTKTGRFVVVEPVSTLSGRLARSMARSWISPVRVAGRWLGRFVPAISPGTAIYVGPGSTGRLGYASDSTTIELKENSHAKILSGRRGKRLELRFGSIEVHAARQNPRHPLTIVTPGGEVRVIGTAFTLSAGPRSARLRVTRGKVEVVSRSGNSRTEVGEGTTATLLSSGFIATHPVTAITNHFGAGSVLREFALGGDRAPGYPLSLASDFPTKFDRRDHASSLESPEQVPATDWYHTRLRGYVHPPVTGYFTFWIAGDDAAELWLSADDQPGGRRRISRTASATLSFRNWWQDPDQESEPIHLDAGRRYYVEVLHKELGGGDFVSVAWQSPGGEIQVIEGSHLSPYQPEN
jgi:ferric-dicitrate binding protein FerR (iron transport regulator)